MDPSRIVEGINSVYGRLRTYQDSGVSQSTDYVGTARESVLQKLNFKTHFKRPGFFRFETTSSRDESWILWSNKSGLYEWFDGSKEERQFDDLFVALNGSLSITRGVCPAVANLLMPAIAGPRIESLNLQNRGTVFLNEEECHLLEHTAVNQLSPVHLSVWVSVSRSVILKTLYKAIIDPARLTAKFGWDAAPEDFELAVQAIKNVDEKTMGRVTEPYAIIEETSYSQIALNEEIPDEVFSIEGPIQDQS